MTKLIIRPANVDDVEQIMQFVIDLAIYEKEPDAVQATPSDLKQALFCDKPQAYCLIAELDGTSIGFALYFYSFSTWLGKHGIYLEDLYVSPEYRGVGAGKALLQELAKTAVAKNLGRVEWSVLDWNEPAINFYKAMGAQAMDEWTVHRLSGDALTRFAKT